MDEKKEELYNLRKKIQALEWDIKFNKLPNNKITYYNRLVEKFNQLRGEESEEFLPMKFE